MSELTDLICCAVIAVNMPAAAGRRPEQRAGRNQQMQWMEVQSRTSKLIRMIFSDYVNILIRWGLKTI